MVQMLKRSQVIYIVILVNDQNCDRQHYLSLMDQKNTTMAHVWGADRSMEGSTGLIVE